MKRWLIAVAMAAGIASGMACSEDECAEAAVELTRAEKQLSSRGNLRDWDAYSEAKAQYDIECAGRVSKETE
jgi:hypothetical protein